MDQLLLKNTNTHKHTEDSIPADVLADLTELQQLWCPLIYNLQVGFNNTNPITVPSALCITVRLL